MCPVDVDPIRLEPLEARLYRGHHGLAAVAGDQPVGIGRSAIGELGGKNEIFAPPVQQSAEEFFGLAELIDIRRVDEVAAGLGIGVEDRPRLLSGSAP